jgi:hypothetical protein
LSISTFACSHVADPAFAGDVHYEFAATRQDVMPWVHCYSCHRISEAQVIALPDNLVGLGEI